MGVLDLLHLTFFDFDGSKDYTEEVYVDDVDGYLIDEASEVKLGQDENGRIMFQSTAIGFSADNPTDPLALSEEQRKRSAMVIVQGQSSVRVKLGITCDPNGCGNGPDGRTFFFGADSSLSAKCTA